MISGITLNKAESIFQKVFVRYAKDNGYEVPQKNNSAAYKKTEFGYLYIGNNITDVAFKLEAVCTISARIDTVEDLVALYAKEIESRDLSYYAGNFITIRRSSTQFVHLLNKKFEIENNRFIIERNEESVILYSSLFIEIIENHMMPELQKLLNYKLLENRIREATNNYEDFEDKPKSGIRFSEFLNPYYYGFKMLIIAKLANVKDFDVVFDKLNKNMNDLLVYGNTFKKYPVVLNKIYQQLKTM